MSVDRHPYVYRVYDGEGLIYIGSTIRLWTRLAEHRRQSWWSRSAVRIRAELAPSLKVARRTEMEAILSELPRWNVYEQAQLIPTWDDEEFEAYLIRWVINALSARDWQTRMFGRPRADAAVQTRRILRRFKLHHGYDFDTSHVPELQELA